MHNQPHHTLHHSTARVQARTHTHTWKHTHSGKQTAARLLLLGLEEVVPALLGQPGALGRVLVSLGVLDVQRTVALLDCLQMHSGQNVDALCEDGHGRTHQEAVSLGVIDKEDGLALELRGNAGLQG